MNNTDSTRLQLALAKKKFAYKFISYIVGTERETKKKHSEPLSSNSLSRTQHGKISNKKIEDNGVQANCCYAFIS